METNPCPHDLEIVNRGPVVWLDRPAIWMGNEDDKTVVVAGERAYTLRCKLCGHELIRVIRIGI